MKVPDIIKEVFREHGFTDTRLTSVTAGDVAELGSMRAHVVWAVDPERRRIATFRPGEEPTVAEGRGSVSASPVLPEFTLDVAALFEGLDA